MTKEEWLASDVPEMLNTLGGSISERKLRLFSCACVRQITHRLSAANRKALVVAEKFADGEASDGRREKAWTEICNVLTLEHTNKAVPLNALRMTLASEVKVNTLCIYWNVYYTPGFQANRKKKLANLFRDMVRHEIYDFPLTPDILSLARATYQNRIHDGSLNRLRCRILADALEEAGCVDQEALTQLREHKLYRGCWSIDCILEKSLGVNMIWLTNTYDPKRYDARSYHVHNPMVHSDIAWKEHLAWLEDKILGEPKASETYSVQQLKQMGMVGVYSRKSLE